MVKLINKKEVKKNKKTTVRKFTFRFFLFGVSSVVFIVFLLTTISNIGVQIYRKYKEKDELDAQLLKLREEEAKLTVDVERMKDPEYVARYLREKFLYSKDGEYIIRIPED